MDVTPVAQYKRWTIAQLDEATNELRKAWCEHNPRPKKTTKQIATEVVQGIGETATDVMSRAKALAKQTGKAIPFRFTRS